MWPPGFTVPGQAAPTPRPMASGRRRRARCNSVSPDPVGDAESRQGDKDRIVARMKTRAHLALLSKSGTTTSTHPERQLRNARAQVGDDGFAGNGHLAFGHKRPYAVGQIDVHPRSKSD